MHTEVLGRETQKSLEVLGKSEIMRPFYLAGGTALALYMGHRLSYDLDFFSAKNVDPKKISKALESLGDFSDSTSEKGTLHGVFERTKVSFLHYPYEMLGSMNLWNGIQMANIQDIACMKIDAVANRGAKKDFVDVYFLLQQYHLMEILNNFEKKYSGIRYNMLHILKSLTYFDEAENDPEPQYLVKPVAWALIKRRLETEVKKLI